MAEDKQKNGAKKARRPSALKRDIQAMKNNERNRSFRSKVSTAVRSLKDSVSKKDTAAAKASMQSVFSLMDKGVKKGIFKQNKASRVKSRLSATVSKA